MPKPLDRRIRNREHDAKRRAEQPWRAWYSTAQWQEARRDQLARQPWCERCATQGKRVQADTVNHRAPHKGNWSLFISSSNHESVCKACHDGAIQREERRGYRIGSDVSGRPLDPNHPWNAR